jgi:hypothetical protein
MEELQTVVVHSNEEYIVPKNAAKEPPVLKSLFRAIDTAAY